MEVPFALRGMLRAARTPAETLEAHKTHLGQLIERLNASVRQYEHLNTSVEKASAELFKALTSEDDLLMSHQHTAYDAWLRSDEYNELQSKAGVDEEVFEAAMRNYTDAALAARMAETAETREFNKKACQVNFVAAWGTRERTRVFVTGILRDVEKQEKLVDEAQEAIDLKNLLRERREAQEAAAAVLASALV